MNPSNILDQTLALCELKNVMLQNDTTYISDENRNVYEMCQATVSKQDLVKATPCNQEERDVSKRNLHVKTLKEMLEQELNGKRENPPMDCAEGYHTFNKEVSFPYSLLMLRLNSLLRTGKVENSFSTVTVVPTWRAVFLSEVTDPVWSKVKCVPTASFLVLVSTVKLPKAQSELSASPLKPKVVK
ncbi:hypothetical protein M5K25_011451 [Dendrobium thyrsiflorum]|uniref:Uncharacterized protein n=1 Tax=Dendrobium thyrsiflorum TaxID=117978 RepID=A0ABD0VA94_DENTH